MMTFVLMTKMAHQDADIIEVATKLKGRVRLEGDWVQAIKEKCPSVRFLAHYALLGQWDFMDIYEAPDEETAAVISMVAHAHGAHRVESWTAIPNERLHEIIEALESGCGDKTQ